MLLWLDSKIATSYLKSFEVVSGQSGQSRGGRKDLDGTRLRCKAVLEDRDDFHLVASLSWSPSLTQGPLPQMLP